MEPINKKANTQDSTRLSTIQTKRTIVKNNIQCFISLLLITLILSPKYRSLLCD